MIDWLLSVDVVLTDSVLMTALGQVIDISFDVLEICLCHLVKRGLHTVCFLFCVEEIELSS